MKPSILTQKRNGAAAGWAGRIAIQFTQPTFNEEVTFHVPVVEQPMEASARAENPEPAVVINHRIPSLRRTVRAEFIPAQFSIPVGRAQIAAPAGSI